jgi:hypothetical protein
VIIRPLTGHSHRPAAIDDLRDLSQVPNGAAPGSVAVCGGEVRALRPGE